jgi:acyl-coenzyme A thioesterase PaaI-like protein
MTSDKQQSDAVAQGKAPAEWTRREMKGIPASMGALWTQKNEDGSWRYAIELDETHCNAQGFIHGGVLMSFMDHGLSLIIWEKADRAMSSTLHLDNHFLNALKAPAFVELEGTIIKQGRKLVFARGILRANGKDIMESTGVWSVVPAPQK